MNAAAVATPKEKAPPKLNIPRDPYELALLASGFKGNDPGRLWKGSVHKLRLFLNATDSTQAAEIKGELISIPSHALHAFWDGNRVGIASREECFFHKSPTDFSRLIRLFLEQIYMLKLLEQRRPEEEGR